MWDAAQTDGVCRPARQCVWGWPGVTGCRGGDRERDMRTEHVPSLTAPPDGVDRPSRVLRQSTEPSLFVRGVLIGTPKRRVCEW